jgi:hypothetical protein
VPDDVVVERFTSAVAINTAIMQVKSTTVLDLIP